MLFLHFGSRQDICSWKTGMRAGFTGLVPPSESTEESCPPQLGPVWLFLDCHVQNSLRNWCGVFRESLQKRRGERASAALPGMCVAWTWTLQCEAIKNMHLRRFINVPPPPVLCCRIGIRSWSRPKSCPHCKPMLIGSKCN